MFRKKYLRREDGQATVEFAMVIPIFILVLVAIMEFCWISYQQMNFRYSYVHASWDLTESIISTELNGSAYQDPMEQIGKSITIYPENPLDAPKLDNLVKKIVKNNSFWGLNEDWLTVSGTTAKCDNEEKKFNVPGRFGNVEGTKMTRKMNVESSLTYHIQPLTFFGRTIVGGDGIVTTGKIETKRIVSTTQRTR